MDAFTVKKNYTTGDLIRLVERLCDPQDGCPWDRIQTHESIRQNLLEETCEVMEAIDTGDRDALKEELGDLLLQVTLHSEMERRAGSFDIDDVADGICKKLVLRHPHIFGDVVAEDSARVLKNWEDIKRVEKEQKTGSEAIEAVPRALPSLMRSQKVQKRAAYVGFDYTDTDMAMADLESELQELREALSSGEGVAEELGDLIFSAVNVARFAGLDAELCCERACDKFAVRFKRVESLAAEKGVDMSSSDIQALNQLWRQAKQNQ